VGSYKQIRYKSEAGKPVQKVSEVSSILMRGGHIAWKLGQQTWRTIFHNWQTLANSTELGVQVAFRPVVTTVSELKNSGIITYLQHISWCIVQTCRTTICRNCSSWQSTRGDPSAWSLGWGLTILTTEGLGSYEVQNDQNKREPMFRMRNF